MGTYTVFICFAIKQDRWFYLLVEEPLLDDPEVREPPDDIPPPLVREEEEPDGRLIVLLDTTLKHDGLRMLPMPPKIDGLNC